MKSFRETLAYFATHVFYAFCLLINAFCHCSNVWFQGAAIGERSVQQVKQEAKDVLNGSYRSMAVSLAFRLIMGVGYYKEGFLLSGVRTERMQQCKRDIIMAMKNTLFQSLQKNDKLHKDFCLQWDKKTGFIGLEDLNVQVTHFVIRRLLNLPSSLDMQKIRDIGNLDTDILLDRGILYSIQCLMGWKSVDDEKLCSAQRYLRDFVYSGDWKEDSFCQQVIDCGQKHHVDARGVLAELLSGACANITKVLSVLLWHALKGQDAVRIKSELEKACRDCRHLTDVDFVHPHRKLDDSKATEGRKNVHKWVSWVLQSYPNLQKVTRQDPKTGVAHLINLKQLSEITQSPDFVFAGGAYGCPGQNLVHMVMPLALRCYFSHDTKFELECTPASGTISTKYHDVVGELEVKWSNDAVQLQQRRGGDLLKRRDLLSKHPMPSETEIRKPYPSVFRRTPARNHSRTSVLKTAGILWQPSIPPESLTRQSKAAFLRRPLSRNHSWTSVFAL